MRFSHETIVHGTLEGRQHCGKLRKCWMEKVKDWMSMPVLELLTMTSRRRDWKKVSDDDLSLTPPWRRNQMSGGTEGADAVVVLPLNLSSHPDPNPFIVQGATVLDHIITRLSTDVHSSTKKHTCQRCHLLLSLNSDFSTKVEKTNSDGNQ